LFRFFTIHGSTDEVIPVEDAYEFAKLIPNHKLRIIKGANHCYTAHRKEVSDALVDCITTNEVKKCELTIHPLFIYLWLAICLNNYFMSVVSCLLCRQWTPQPRAAYSSPLSMALIFADYALSGLNFCFSTREIFNYRVALLVYIIGYKSCSFGLQSYSCIRS
jgi:hypothetical protein